MDRGRCGLGRRSRRQGAKRTLLRMMTEVEEEEGKRGCDEREMYRRGLKKKKKCELMFYGVVEDK